MSNAKTAADSLDHPMLFSDLGSRQVVADFSGGTLSSDAGALLLRQVDINLGLQTAGPSTVAHFRSGGSWGLWELESILAVPLVIGAALISGFCYVFQLPSIG